MGVTIDRYITTTMTIPKASSRGPGYWKMNTSILTDKQYNIEMTAYLKLWTTEKQRFRSDTMVGKRKGKHKKNND